MTALNVKITQHGNIGPTTPVEGTANSASAHLVFGFNLPAHPQSGVPQQALTVQSPQPQR